MGAEIFSVGTELLLGQIVDTNAVFLAQQLSNLGVDCFHKTTVGDNQGRLVAALRTALVRADIIISTGGLGPTEDDLTAAGVAEALGVELYLDEPAAEAIRQLIAKRGYPFLPSHLKQAQIPVGSIVLPNPVGTAPGFWIEKDGKTIISMPGPPHEMRAMFTESVAPRLQQRAGGVVIVSRVLHFMGIGESMLEERLKDLIEAQTNPTIAPLAGMGEVRLRITAKILGREAAQALIAPVEAEIRQRVGDYIVSTDNEPLEVSVDRLLKARGLTLAVAESCTGGLIANKLTNIPGASEYFMAGLVTYSNEAKIKLLGVQEATLAQYGAVSAQTATEMARGARNAGAAQIGVSTTGIAGPTGATAEKPVGLVYIAVSSDQQEVCEEFRFRGDREMIKNQAANAALNLLRKTIEQAS
jgi:nicotinamide-nucleotide amidase